MFNDNESLESGHNIDDTAPGFDLDSLAPEEAAYNYAVNSLPPEEDPYQEQLNEQLAEAARLFEQEQSDREEADRRREAAYESWLIEQQYNFHFGVDEGTKLWDYDMESQAYIISKFPFELFDKTSQTYIRANYPSS